MFKKIEGRPDLVRSETSGAILLNDTQKRDEYLQKKAMMDAKRNMENTINNNDGRLDELENDMKEIKTLLRTLIDGNS